MAHLPKKGVKRPWHRPKEQTNKSWGGDTSIYRSKRWINERKEYFSILPYCVHCLRQNRQTKANVLDHNKNIKQNPNIDFWDKSNWQGLCHTCHNRKTRNEQTKR